MDVAIKPQTRSLRLVILVLVLGASLPLLQFVMRVGATGNNITGNVKTPAGANLYNAVVYATMPSSATVLYGPVTTNSSGNYTLVIPVAGTFDIHINPPANTGYTPYTDSSVSVTSSQVINYQFTALSRTFSGNLSDSTSTPIASATVRLYPSAGGSYCQTSSDASGNFTISSVPAGNYSLYLNGTISGTLGFTLSQAYASSINLINGNLSLNLVVPVATLSLTAYNDGGSVGLHAGNGSVIARATSGTTYLYPGDPGTSISLASSGSFSGSATGTLETLVGATYAGSGIGATSYPTSICETTTISSNYDCLIQPLTVTGSMSINVPQTSPATRTYSGQLTDSGNNPLVGATVTLLQNGENTATATTDASGNFTINAMPKKYYLQVVASIVDGMSSFTLTQPSATPTIDLTSTSGTQNLQVNTATLTITANDGSGNPNYFTNVNVQTSSGTATLYAGDPGEAMTVYSAGFSTTASPANNVGTSGTIVGASYSAKGLGVTNPNRSICDFVSGSTWNCITTALTVSGNTSLNVPF